LIPGTVGGEAPLASSLHLVLTTSCAIQLSSFVVTCSRTPSCEEFLAVGFFLCRGDGDLEPRNAFKSMAPQWQAVSTADRGDTHSWACAARLAATPPGLPMLFSFFCRTPTRCEVPLPKALPSRARIEGRSAAPPSRMGWEEPSHHFTFSEAVMKLGHILVFSPLSFFCESPLSPLFKPAV